MIYMLQSTKGESLMKTRNRFNTACKKVAAWLFIIAFLVGLVPPFEIALFPRTLAAPVYLPGNEAVVSSPDDLKTALENPSITTIYFGANISMRSWGLTSQDYPNTSTTSNSYNNSTNMINVAARTGGQLTIVGTYNNIRRTYTDRRTSDQGSVPIRLPSTAMNITFKDINIYGFNYWGLLYGDNARHTIVMDNVFGVMPQFLHNDLATVVVRNSVLKVRDTGLRIGEEFFESANVRLEGKNVFDHQPTDNCTMFWVKDGSNRSLTVTNNAEATLIERGNNSYGILYPSGNSLIMGESGKLTSVVAEREGETVGKDDLASITYTTGYNYGTAYRTAGESSFTFSGSEAHASVTIGAGSELTIIHPFSSSNTSNDILRTTTSAGVTINEGGILNIYSNAQNSRVLDTSNLYLNNPRLVTLLTTSSNNYLFDGTVPVKANKLKSIRYYNSPTGSNYDFTKYANANVTAPSGIASLANYKIADGGYNTNRPNPTTWFFQTTNSFDVTSGNINGTGTVSNSTYSGTTAVSGVATSITNTNFNASTMRVVQIDGDYSRRPTIDQAEAGQTSITGTGVPDAFVTLYDPSGNPIGNRVSVDEYGNWIVSGLPPLIAKQVYSATQQANIAGYASSPSTQVTMTVNAKTFRLIASNNATKSSMTGYLNAAFNNVAGAKSFDIQNVRVIIFNDPDTVIPADLDFDTMYDSVANHTSSASYTGIAYQVEDGNIRQNAGADDYMSVGREINYNCMVWSKAVIEADGITSTLFDTVSWKNIFTPYPVWARAVIAGSVPLDRLYIYEVVDPNRTYGIPYMGDGTTIYSKSPYAYDSVQLTAASLDLAYSDDLVKHWEGYVGPGENWDDSFKTTYPRTAYPLKFDSTFPIQGLYDGTDPSKYTLNYVKIPERWENVTVKYVLANGNEIPNVNGISSGSSNPKDMLSIPLMIGANDQPIANKSANINAVTSFHALGGRYTPPSGGANNYSPIGWYVGTPTNFTGTWYNTQTDFGDNSFNPIFDGSNSSPVLYIVYSDSMFQVDEEYWRNGSKLDTDKVQYFETSDTGDYTITPKRIGSSVPVGWEIWRNVLGTDKKLDFYTFSYDAVAASNSSITPVSNQYDIFPTAEKALATLRDLEGSGPITIKFLYVQDDKNNGIPNTEEAALTIRWRGFTVDGSMWTIQPTQTVYGRASKTSLIPNNYATPSSVGKYGDPSHTIDNTVVPNAPNAKWMFDEAPEHAQKSAMFGGAGDAGVVNFDYAFSTQYNTQAVKVKDKDQYVDELYHYIDEAGVEHDVPNISSTKTYILEGGSYSKVPLSIPDYIYVGYRWSDGYSATYTSMYQNDMSPPPITKSPTGERQTVTSIYREAAEGSVTVNWVGKTYAGGTITFNTVTKKGYIGEQISIYPNDAAVTSSWSYEGSYSTTPTVATSTSISNPLVFALGDNHQTGHFQFNESFDEVVITAKYVSDDGSIDFTQTFPKTLANSTDPIVVNSFTLSGYDLTGWVVKDSYGNTLQSSATATSFSLSAPVTILPTNGTQTITFNYKSNITSLYIRCYDETGQEIPGQAEHVSNVKVGDIYYAKAPIVEVNGVKYALLDNEPLVKSINITSGANLVTFRYQKIASTSTAYMILKEVSTGAANGSKDDIIGYRVFSTASSMIGSMIEAPDLSDYYYRRLQSDINQSNSDYKEYTGTELTFLYTKDLLDVKIIPVNSTGTSISVYEDRLDDVARAGEMYDATCNIKIPGYTLTDPVSKKVYATSTSLSVPIIVPFTYKQDELGDVSVVYYYGNDSDKDNKNNQLGAYTLSAVVGSKLTVTAQGFVGFSTPSSLWQEVTVTAAKQTVYFQYADNRKTVNVQYVRKDGNNWTSIPAPTGAVTEIKVAGTSCVVDVPYVQNYLLYGYTTGTPPLSSNDITTLPLGKSQIPLSSVNDGMTVYLCYEDANTSILEKFVTVTVRGVSGSKVLYEYSVNRLKGSGNYDVNAQNVFGYKLENPSVTTKSIDVDSTPLNPVVFDYTSLSMDVTIKARDTGGATITSFSDIHVTATEGQPFSYNAPYIPGWNLASAITQPISTLTSLNNVLTFSYTPASGNVTVLLKEDDEKGRIIQTISHTITSLTDPVPMPTLPTYTKLSTEVTLTSLDSGQIVEYYYKKDMRQVEIERHKYGGARIDIAIAGSFRVGEVASFTAPTPPTPLPDYRLFGSAQQMVIVEAGGSSKIVTFEYEDITTVTDELVINAVDGGKLLYTYTLTGNEGQSVSVPAPYVPGYVLENNQSAVQTGTFGSTQKSLDFEYRKNVSTVTVDLRMQNGGDITYLAPAGFLTSFETEMGKNCTVVAPNLDGYVLTATQSPQTTLSAIQTASDQTITFYYRLVEDLFVTHTIVGMDSTNTALYTYSFSVKQGGGTTAYTPATIHNYVCTTTNNISTLPNSSDGVIVFRYALAMATITVNAVDISSASSMIDGFPIYYYDGEIGKPYSVRAPYIERYVLASDQPLYHTFTSLSTVSSITFNYKAFDNSKVNLELRETGGNIIRMIEVDEEYTRSRIEALLQSDYYVFDYTNSTVTSLDTSSPAGIYTFYYKKKTRPIVVNAVDSTNTANILTWYNATGRVGEMYKAVAPSYRGYSLVDSPVQMINVPDGDETTAITVTFSYAENKAGDITVRAFYTDGAKKILFEYVMSGTVGTTVDISVQDVDLAGWKLKQPQDDHREHTFFENTPSTTADDLTYEFEYVMREAKITVSAIDINTGQPVSGIQGYPQTLTVQAGVPITIKPPDAPAGYTLIGADGPYINHIFNESATPVSLTFQYQQFSTSSTIVLVYQDIYGKPLGSKALPGAIGSVTPLLSGIAPPFDATNYTLKSITINGVQKDINTVTATYTAAQQEFVLTYEYSGIKLPPADHGTVTSLLPQNPTKGETVTGTITPEDGYELATLLITSSTGTSIPYTFVPNTVPPTPNADGTYTFTYTQQDGGVTITPTFRAKGSGTSPVTVNPTDNGSVTVNPQNPAKNSTVTITLTPNPGYKLKSVTVTDKDGNPVVPVTLVSPSSTLGSEGVYTATYTQPEGGAIVNAEYEPIGGGGSGPVTVDATDNGSVTVNPTNPGAGDTVTLTITPSTGYDLDPTTFTIKDGSGNTITNYSINYNSDGTYTVKYIQPANGAKVHAEFVPSVLILNAKNGRLTVDNYTPLPGTTVTITALPDANYRVNTVTVKDCNNQAVTSLTKNSNGTWSYTQPQGGVTIIGTFVSTGGAKASVTSVPDHGDVVINPDPPKPGEAVTVIITPDTNYTVKDVTIKDATGKSLPYTLRYIGNGKYEAVYIQPDGEASINVSYAKSVDIRQPANGVITANTENPNPGDAVKITVKPNDGYTPDNVTVTDKNGNVSYVTLTPNGDGTWSGTYVQPEGGVTIDGTLSFRVTVSVTTTGNGVVIINPVQPDVDDTVYVVTIPGYENALTGLTIKQANGDTVDFDDLGDGLYSFVQPSSNVSVAATFGLSSIELIVKNGQVTMQPANPKPGQKVTLTFQPNDGYLYAAPTIKDKNNPTTDIKILSNSMARTTSTSTLEFTWGLNSPELVISMAFARDDTFDRSKVEVTQTGNGLVSIDTFTPDPGDLVTISTMPAPGYILGTITVTNAGEPIQYTSIGNGMYTYTQPAGKALIDVKFVGAAPNITINTPSNGIVDLLVSSYVAPGKNVEIYVAPVSGYTLGSITILDGANNVVEGIVLTPTKIVQANVLTGAYTGTYVQPSSGSKIIATFTKSIDLTVGKNGTVKTNTMSPFPGDEVTLTIRPNTGYTLSRLEVMNEMVFALRNSNGEYTYTFTQPLTGSAKITVEFAQLSNFGVNSLADDPYKAAAKAEIEKRYNQLTTLNSGNYTSQQLLDLAKARDDALDAIDDALTVGDVEAAKNHGIDTMNAIPVGTGGSSGGGVVGGGGGSASSGTTGSTVSPSEHGRLIIDNINAKEGETVTMYPLPEHGYELDKLEIKDSNGKDVAYTKNADGTYSFIQPKGKVTINTIFKPMAIAPDASDVSAILNTTDHMAYVSGRGSGAFAPTSSLTRAEAAQLFFELLVNKNVPINKSFPDVPADAWFAKAVNSLASLGIITGLPDGNFNPNSSVTRAEFVAIAVKFAAVAPCDVRFSDVPKTHWSYVHISTAVNLGWISSDVGIWGFAPDRPITRAEMVSIINKVLKRTPDKAYIDSHSSLVQFTDVGMDHWAYYDIMEAANAHNYTKDDAKETWK